MGVDEANHQGERHSWTARSASEVKEGIEGESCWERIDVDLWSPIFNKTKDANALRRESLSASGSAC